MAFNVDIRPDGLITCRRSTSDSYDRYRVHSNTLLRVKLQRCCQHAAVSKALPQTEEEVLYIRGDITGPTSIAHPRTIVVAGNVSRSAKLVSAGDIIVLGRLEGIAFAGSDGRAEAFISAQHIRAAQVGIAGILAPQSVTTDNGAMIRVSIVSGSLEVSGLSVKGPTPPPPPEPTFSRVALARLMQTVRQASPPAKAALVTGIYILLAGMALIFLPELVFGLLFDTTQVSPGWIQAGGTLAALFGMYYLGAVHGEVTRQGLKSFYQATIIGRLALFLSFSLLSAFKRIQWQLMIPGVVNLLGAISMIRALRKDEREDVLYVKSAS